MGNSVGVEPLKLHLETNSQLQIYSLWRSVCMLFFNRATKISMVISSMSRSKNFVLDAFLNANFSVLSVALSAAPDINTAQAQHYINWWQQQGCLCLLCVVSTDSHSEPICIYMQEWVSESSLSGTKISLALSASNTRLVLFLFLTIPIGCFLLAPDSSCPFGRK